MKNTLVSISMVVLGLVLLGLSLFLMVQNIQYQASVGETWKATAIYHCKDCAK